MNRRRILTMFGSSLLFKKIIAYNPFTTPAMAAEINITNISDLPDNFTNPSINLKFEKFIIKTQNIDVDEDVDITVKSGLSGKELTSVTKNPISKNITESTGENHINLDVDLTGFDNNSGVTITESLLSENDIIDISIELLIEHPDVKTKKLSKNFSINIVEPSTITIDDFSEGSLSNYQNDTSLINVTNTNEAIKNDYYITTINDLYTSSNPNIYSPNDTGLNYYPKVGDTIVFFVRLNEPNEINAGLAFATSGEPNTSSKSNAGNHADEQYAVNIRGRTNEINIVKRNSSSTREILAEDTVQLDNYEREWLKVIIDWTNTDIIATVFDSDENEIKSISGEDNDYTDGGIGFIFSCTQNAGADSARVDYIHKK